MSTVCLDPRPHKPHTYRLRGSGMVDCPGHNNPEPEREKWYDCEQGTADLCPKHASVDQAITLLRELAKVLGNDQIDNHWTDEDEVGLDYDATIKIGTIRAVRAFLDSLKETDK